MGGVNFNLAQICIQVIPRGSYMAKGSLHFAGNIFAPKLERNLESWQRFLFGRLGSFVGSCPVIIIQHAISIKVFVVGFEN